MAVIEHREYKVICDFCAADITTWYPYAGKRPALKAARKETGLPLINGRMACPECQNQPPAEPLPTAADFKRFFSTAQRKSAFDIIDSFKAPDP